MFSVYDFVWMGDLTCFICVCVLLLLPRCFPAALKLLLKLCVWRGEKGLRKWLVFFCTGTGYPVTVKEEY